MVSTPRVAIQRIEPRVKRIASKAIVVSAAVLVGACSAGSGGGGAAASKVEMPSASGLSPIDGSASDPSTSTSTGRPASVPSTPGSSLPTKGGGGDAPRPSGDGAPLSPGPILFVALGDSLTEGSGDDSGQGGFVGRLGATIDSGSRAGSEVLNLGKSGWDSSQVIAGTDGEPSQLVAAEARIRETVAGGRSALATVLVGSNDLWYLYEYGSQDGTTESEEADNLAAYQANLDAIVRRLDDAGARVVIAINDDQSRRPVATDSAMREATLPATTASEMQRMSGQARRYADVVRTVASTHGAVVVDFLDAPLFRDPKTLADDGIHPNEAGYAQMADIWLEAIRPMIG